MPPYVKTPAREAAHEAARIRGGWTDERIAQMRELNKQGHSANQIAIALGGVTRCAVIGKLNRLGDGLNSAESAKRAAALKSPPKPREPKLSAPAKPKLMIVGNGAVMENPDSPRKPWVDPVALQERANAPAGEVREFTGKIGPSPCKWPLGNPGEEGFHFCEKPAVVGKPYCPGHCSIAFQPSKEADPTKALLRSVRRYA